MLAVIGFCASHFRLVCLQRSSFFLLSSSDEAVCFSYIYQLALFLLPETPQPFCRHSSPPPLDYSLSFLIGFPPPIPLLFLGGCVFSVKLLVLGSSKTQQGTPSANHFGTRGGVFGLPWELALAGKGQQAPAWVTVSPHPDFYGPDKERVDLCFPGLCAAKSLFLCSSHPFCLWSPVQSARSLSPHLFPPPASSSFTPHLLSLVSVSRAYHRRKYCVTLKRQPPFPPQTALSSGWGPRIISLLLVWLHPSLRCLWNWPFCSTK